MTEARNQSIDRETLRAWAEMRGLPLPADAVMKAALSVLTQLAEAEGTIAWFREHTHPLPPWPDNPVRLQVETGMWLGMPGGRLYLPEAATITIEYPKTEDEPEEAA